MAGSKGADPEVAVAAASAFGAVTVLLAWVVLKERIGPLQWLALLLVFGGVGVLAAPRLIPAGGGAWYVNWRAATAG